MKDLRVGDYVLQQPPLGKGAFGKVFLGRNTNDGEYRAVKVVSNTVGSTELTAASRCAEEIKDHPNLMPILHVGRVGRGSHYYFVMPLADDYRGRNTAPPPSDYEPMTLSRYLRDRAPLPVNDVLTIADRLMIAVRRLHRAGLVHCDIKPSNIVRYHGKWRLSDFGISIRRNRSAGGPGTRWFLPPEGSGDFPGDVYALGKTLLLLVTGLPNPSKAPEADDPFALLCRDALVFPYRDERNDRLKELIRDACTEKAGRRIMLDDLHHALARLMDKCRVRIVFTEDISAEDLRTILEEHGLTPGEIAVEHVPS